MMPANFPEVQLMCVQFNTSWPSYLFSHYSIMVKVLRIVLMNPPKQVPPKMLCEFFFEYAMVGYRTDRMWQLVP